MKRPFIITNETVRANLITHILNLPLGSGVNTDTETSRSLEQNAAQWPILQAFSKQLKWSVNGELTQLSSDEYKDILTAAFEKETNPRLASGFDSGVVMLGRRTRHYSKEKFAEWLTFLNAAADIKNIKL